MMNGLFQTGSQLAALASAFATILLVSLTAQYAMLTQQLVEESEKSRIQRKKELENDREREVRMLRRSLHEEIGKIENLEEYAKEYQVGKSVAKLSAPTTIYQTNSGEIGLLSDDEINYIVEYYTQLEHVNEMLRLQRKMDTTFEMDVFTEHIERGKAFIDYVLRQISFGYFGKRKANDRESYIRHQIEKLADAQNAALSSIEENIEGE